MVPVPFFLNVLVSGLSAPFGWPKVAPGALWVWLLPDGSYSPLRLPIPGLEVVLSPKVVPVGGTVGGC